MLRTKTLITDIKEVPSPWVFNYYLHLPEVLNGQDIMVKSVFNPKDKRPSMSIFVSRKREYRYYDHSTGSQGSKIDLIMTLFKLGFSDAVDKIIEDYNQYLLDAGDSKIQQFQQRAKYQVIDYERRKWTVLDRDYWTSYRIGSHELNKYNVSGLASYTLSNGTNQLRVEGKMIYGYFTSSGELYKTYQPRASERRFMKIKQHIQGLDQLKYETDTLIITKALKDIICLDVMDLGVEAVAPDSENMLLPALMIETLKGKYKHIITLMDNDAAGIASMEKYHESYNLPYIISPLEKDPSDSIKIRGINQTRATFKTLIEQCIKHISE